MKRIYIIPALISAMTAGLASCSGWLMSSDFGFDDYGPSYDYYWPNYGNIYNPPLGYYGPGWDVPPPRPIINRPQPVPPNGANRPNFVPSKPSAPQRPVTTSPTGQPRPGNMGQPPVQNVKPENGNNQGSSSPHRGR
jgi:hypothetical protein